MIRIRPEVVNTSGQEEAHKNNENEKASDMYDSMTTLFKICGSYSTQSGKTSKTVCTGHFIYCIILQLIVLIISARYFTVFRHGDQFYKTIGLLAFSYYYVMMALLSFVCFHSNYKFLSMFYVAVDKYYNKYGLFLDVSKTKTWLRRIVVATLILIVLSTFIAIVVIYFHVDRNALLIKSIYTPFDEEEGYAFLIASIVSGIIGAFYHIIALSNFMFLLTTVHIIKGEFQHIWRTIRDNINNKQLDNLEQLRLQHHNLTEIVENGNQIFRPVAGIIYGYGIPMICLLLYGVTTSRFDIADVLAMSSMLAIAIMEMFITTFMGADLNDKVSTMK